jgi:hypothetical protein
MINRLTATLAMLATFLPTAASTQDATHLGVPSNRIVNLAGVYLESTFCAPTDYLSMVRVRTTGQYEPTAFVVPTGMRLIITDVSWIVSHHPNDKFVAGSVVRVGLRAHEADGNFVGAPYNSVGVPIPADSTELLTGSEHLVTGVVIAQGRQLCATAVGMRQPPEASVNSFTIYDHSPVDVHVAGYLVRY